MTLSSDTILVIADTQAPFQHKDYLEFLVAVKEKYMQKRHLVVHVGDEMDFHALAPKYPSDPDGLSPRQEYEKGIEFMKSLYEEFPKCFVCTSNHTSRPLRKAFLAGIPKAFLKTYKSFMQAPQGWNWCDTWEINNILFEHGENVSGPTACLLAAKSNRKSTVIGHQHTHAGVIYSASSNDRIFGMNVGCGIDINAYAFAYGKTIREKPILGCGVIVEKTIPLFIPMLVDANNRWIKKIP